MARDGGLLEQLLIVGAGAALAHFIRTQLTASQRQFLGEAFGGPMPAKPNTPEEPEIIDTVEVRPGVFRPRRSP